MKLVSLRVERQPAYSATRAGELVGMVEVENHQTSMKIELSNAVLNVIIRAIAGEAQLRAMAASSQIKEAIADQAESVLLQGGTLPAIEGAPL